MNWGGWLLWGFVATLVMTTIMAGSQGLRLTRMNMPYMLGAMFTPSRDRAKLIGFGIHAWGQTNMLGRRRNRVRPCGVRADRGHASAAGGPPAHGQRAAGAPVMRQLEPPGFLALNYGY
jgi:hypothetical protein